MAALVTYPCQNLRARQQAGVQDSNQITVRSILQREGVRGLYRGLAPYLLHVVPNVCLVFLAYEAVAGTN